MPRGGARRGAGRPPSLPLKQRLQVGKACERDWNKMYFGGDVRPYRAREQIIDQHVSGVEYVFGIKVTPRAIASWWALFRKSRKP
jgi:hypothetical protein